jgi:hypothetical protein
MAMRGRRRARDVSSARLSIGGGGLECRSSRRRDAKTSGSSKSTDKAAATAKRA